ncbi:hypothetical protein [Brevibacillus fulvus]|uniref:Uncharacterized protein n=1 Tax=Brevibacillus fulvus TaxID=1125967 RepID=A0A938Y684_9BACL|nr:hypothetical protein [Brevibacillus fulvus]MBM7592302.1 hypothetical protein [Brevibacillus fulvus]
MLANSAMELVDRCYEHHQGLLDLEEFKGAFISYVFEVYQAEVVAMIGHDAFYDHLEELNLANCRKDFDAAVDEWFLRQYGSKREEDGYHDLLFALVKTTVAHCHSRSREELIHDLTKYLTTPTGFMARWKNRKARTSSMYFRYLMKLGIRTHLDIELLVDSWLIEHPHAFHQRAQQMMDQPPRRGRPNNLELSLLFDEIHQVKPELTPRERERIRKIYYYHRKQLTLAAMVEKFKQYLASREIQVKPAKSPQVG